MRPTKLDRSHAPSGLAQNLLTCFTDSALRGLVDVMQMQRKLTSQLLISVNQQQRAKSSALESWMWQRNEALQNNLECGVQMSKDLYLATTQAQADWLQASERLLAEANRNLLQTIQHIAPCGTLPATAMEPVCKAVKVSSCALESMSKATRQVTHFAGTNLGNAALNAARMVREEISAQHHSGTRHH